MTYVLRRVQARSSSLSFGSRLQRYRGLPFVGRRGLALRRWVKQLQNERQGVTPKSKALTPEQQKIQELEARIDRLEREKAILKSFRSLDLGRTQSYVLMDQLSDRESVEVVCSAFDVVRSCYYAHRLRRRRVDARLFTHASRLARRCSGARTAVARTP